MNRKNNKPSARPNIPSKSVREAIESDKAPITANTDKAVAPAKNEVAPKRAELKIESGEQQHLGNLVKQADSTRALTRINFYIMAASAVAIIAGFLLMLGPGTTDEAFEPDIFSTRRIIVAPTICFLGFVAMGVGIIYRPRSKRTKL